MLAPLLAEKLAQGPVLVAEGYVFELARRGVVSRGVFVPEAVLDHPEEVGALHREFVRCGSDVVLALTYYAHEEKMKAAGRVHDLERINKEALRIARNVASPQEFPEALVAGNICNTGVYDPRDPKRSGREVRRMYTDQVQWAADAGVSFIVAETISYLGEALIAQEVIAEFCLPSVVTFCTHKVNGKDDTLDGCPIPEACKRLEDAGALVVGLNCSRGPRIMIPLLRKVRGAVSGHVAALPVPYRTHARCPSFWDLPRIGDRKKKAFPDNLDPYLCDLVEVSDFAEKAVEMGINYVGLCCGASPEMIRAIAERWGRVPPAARYRTDMSRHYIFGENVADFNRRT